MFRRVLALEAQVAAAGEAAAVREGELKDEIEALRRDKRAAEAAAAGVNLEAMQHGDALVQQARRFNATCFPLLASTCFHPTPTEATCWMH